ncbi:unnamed protein product [Sphenostylis stenocarpa]|uniref:Uncharacterized protein n=1 Tax=Sphenostylis stenocarpa TaxID=92480 RepID=A0AA87B6Q0_9FABA|nr:unnamed protein product [Sphenostylis stenocarpa]
MDVDDILSGKGFLFEKSLEGGVGKIVSTIELGGLNFRCHNSWNTKTRIRLDEIPRFPTIYL